MTRLHIDFETRSRLDLRQVGLHRYAEHPTTEVICAGWAIGKHPVTGCHFPGDYTPGDLGISTGNVRVIAHNSPFEYHIWNAILHARHGWPALIPDQMECTMSRAYAMSLPGGLDAAAAALGIDTRKDSAGHRLMLQMCKPRKVVDDTVTWWDDHSRMAKLLAYCVQDVEVERELDHRLLRLSGDA